MMFRCELMADPVVASDGITYERDSIQLWMKTHDVSPHTNTPFDHKMLIPNIMARKQIAAWCEENGVPVPVAPKRVAEAAAAGGGAALAPLLQKPHVTCALHDDEPLRVFCKDCCRGVCTLCAVDTDMCKSHTTKAFKPLLEELKVDREAWARAQEECGRSAEQLCATIQADADAKIQAITAEASALQQQVRSAAAARSAALGAIVQKRVEREELVAGAAASPDVAVKDSAAAAVVASALHRVKAVIPPHQQLSFALPLRLLQLWGTCWWRRQWSTRRTRRPGLLQRTQPPSLPWEAYPAARCCSAWETGTRRSSSRRC